MTIEEMARLQGIRPDQFYKVVDDYQLGQQIGNAMSVNVIERILFQIFKATPLTKKTNLVDRWTSGEAQTSIIESRGIKFQPRPKQIYGNKRREAYTTTPEWEHGKEGLKLKFFGPRKPLFSSKIIQLFI